MSDMKLTTSDTPPRHRAPGVYCRECGKRLHDMTDGAKDIRVDCPDPVKRACCMRKKDVKAAQ